MTAGGGSGGSTFDILSLLEAYEKIHVEGNDEWKKSLWNIYKGRHARKRNNLSYVSETYCSASDVREDFAPRMTLLMKNKQNDENTHFVRVEDGVPVKDKDDVDNDKTNDQEIPSLLSEQSTTQEGLRNRARRGQQQTSGTDNNQPKDLGWTFEHRDNEDLVVDPLEMMAGAFPPRELKEAHGQAKEAMIRYIEAANILIQLLQKL